MKVKQLTYSARTLNLLYGLVSPRLPSLHTRFQLSGTVCSHQTKLGWLFQVANAAVSNPKSKRSPKPTGLMTIRAMIEKHQYNVLEVIDAFTGESYTLIGARSRGLIDLKTQEYVYSHTGERIPMDEAIDEGLVVVEFEISGDENNNERDKEAEREVETRTYAISSVVDQKNRRNVSFPMAMCRRLLSPKSGNYHHNVTGKATYVVEAIKKGYVVGEAVEETRNLQIDQRNKVVVELVGKIRKNVLNPLSVILAFRRAAEQVRNYDTAIDEKLHKVSHRLWLNGRNHVLCSPKTVRVENLIGQSKITRVFYKNSFF